ncbi:MAG: hypothetical protein ACI8X5_002854 [Planctomycetota bacterium]|jgi:hypothetical protein
MDDEGNALCNQINSVISDLLTKGIQVNPTFLGITQTTYSCLQDTVANLLGTSIPGNPSCCASLGNNEDWGPATAIVAERFGWTSGAVRVIVPISDEAPRNGGGSCNQDDIDSITNAIAIANSNNVICSPISGSGSNACVIGLASDLAVGTGGTNFLSTNAQQDLASAISMLLTNACESASDCNKDGVPDECEPDSNGNGTPDECEDGVLNDLDCSEFDRYEELTPNDTLTLITKAHNPSLEQGFLRVVAVDEQNNPIGFDHLIGNTLVLNGYESVEYSINPVDYRAAVAPGALTDVDADGIRDLNGIEYEMTPGQILIPRFFGQGPVFFSELLLVSLSGGRKFETTVDFLVSNDNEVTFSTEHTFRCWDKVSLGSISHLFSAEFLEKNSGNDEEEDINGLESGWIKIDGGVASSATVSIPDPAFYAVLIERIQTKASASLPFESCLQSGHLLSNSLDGDNEELAGITPQDCTSNIARRRAGSLLLYPEFDNLSGTFTVITLTNTSDTESIKAHFVYVGRFGL